MKKINLEMKKTIKFGGCNCRGTRNKLRRTNSDFKCVDCKVIYTTDIPIS